MKKFKPKVNKDIELVPMTDDGVFNLMFLPEHDGFFREDSTASALKRIRYIDFLRKASERYGRFEIKYKGKTAGFILAAGMDARIVGGLWPEFKRKGIYTVARNTLLYLMNSLGLYSITSSIDESNSVMKKFIETAYQTPFQYGLQVNHFNPHVEIGKYPKNVTIRKPKLDTPMFHISFNGELPSVLEPRLPDGSDGEQGNYPEPDTPRVSFSPSVELAFRAIYPNISKLLEGSKEPSITLNVYKYAGKHNLTALTPDEVHDAGVTLEHVSYKAAKVVLLGKVVFENTSDDSGLYYLPKGTDEPRYHSPRVVNVLRTDYE